MKKVIVLLSTIATFSVSALTLKVGVLAPEGTTWANNLSKMGKEIKEATKGAVKIKYYFGGAQGDEPDVLRKIRVGQLHGGLFTGKTLGEINGDVRVMELPFTFLHDRKKALDTMMNLAPFFNKKFEENEFVNLGFFELGLVYFVSQKKTASIDSLKGMKIWSWEGDPLVSAMVEEMKLVSVPLPLPDVLSSLSTGIIHAAYAPPMGIIALQWNTKISYLVDFPISYSTGAFLIGHKKWKRIKPEHQKMVLKISKKYVDATNSAMAKENEDALAAMKGMGIEFLEFPKKDIKTGKDLREQIVKKLTGKLFSKEAYEKFQKEIKK